MINSNSQSSASVSLITGAATGIGRATAVKLAAAGNRILISDLNDDLLLQTKEQLSKAGATFKSVPMDLSEKNSLEAGFAEALEAFGQINHLVNNAGRPLLRPATDVTWEEWDSVINVNLKAAYFLSSLFAKQALSRNQSGAIVNIASTHGLTGLAGRSVYGISKGGLIQMSKMLAIEWAENCIRVNAIAPTTIITPSRAQFLPEGQKREEAKSRIPLNRFPQAEEVAAAVLYLISDDAISITGHTLAIDGGLLAE